MIETIDRFHLNNIEFILLNFRIHFNKENVLTLNI